MKEINWQKAYGPPSQALEKTVSAALREEEQPMKQKRVTGVLVIALVLVLLCAGALAAAQKGGLLDMIRTYKGTPDGTDAPVVITDLPFTGGDSEHVTFSVREAVYDGSIAYLLIDAMPKKAGDVLVWRYADSNTGMDKLGPGGERWWVGVEMSSDTVENRFIPYYVGENGNGLQFMATVMVTGGEGPDALPAKMVFTVLAGDGTHHSISELTCEIPRTAEPVSKSLTPPTGLEGAEIQQILITDTPVQRVVTITFKPLLRVFHSFDYIPDDGRVNYMNYGYGLERDEENGTITQIFYLPTDDQSIGLWANGMKQAVQIDIASGTAAVVPATVTQDGDITVVTINTKEAK